MNREIKERRGPPRRGIKKFSVLELKKGGIFPTLQAVKYSIKYHLEGGAEEKYILRAGGF
ncbi:hypothetical protein K9N08_04810 [Candidatus Gracilibacteria bacterium]|nr:hypothetical protein [Candidatus Gracilibacteria bacterium]MCF7856825.1 hypothetical protein [Candidatus Gracilibacteria bacterium]